jgi:hypothetical protein
MSNNKTIQAMLEKFLPFAQERMGFKNVPNIRLESDEDNAQQPLGKTAYYDPSSSAVTVYVDGRHPKDIMRSISHELVHHTQNGRGEFDKVTTVGEGYAQNDEHLRNMEKEAYTEGNLCFRDWEDSIKTQNESIMEFFGDDAKPAREEEAEIAREVHKEAESLDVPINEPETVGYGLQFLNKLRNAEEIEAMCKAQECSTGLKVAQTIFDEENIEEELNMFEKRNKRLNERVMKKFGYFNEAHTAAHLARDDGGEYSAGDEAHRQDKMHEEAEALDRVIEKIATRAKGGISQEAFEAIKTLYWNDDWPTEELGREVYDVLASTIGASGPNGMSVGDLHKTDANADPYGFLADTLNGIVKDELHWTTGGMAKEAIKKVTGDDLEKGDEVEDPDGGATGTVEEPTLVRGQQGATAEFSGEVEEPVEIEEPAEEEEEDLEELEESNFDKEFGGEFGHLFAEGEEEGCDDKEEPTELGDDPEDEEEDGPEMWEEDLYSLRNQRLHERLIKWSSKKQ